MAKKKKLKKLHKGRTPIPPPGGPMKDRRKHRDKEWKNRIKEDER